MPSCFEALWSSVPPDMKMFMRQKAMDILPLPQWQGGLLQVLMQGPRSLAVLLHQNSP